VCGNAACPERGPAESYWYMRECDEVLLSSPATPTVGALAMCFETSHFRKDLS
jgi:hypothetical protein